MKREQYKNKNYSWENERKRENEKSRQTIQQCCANLTWHSNVNLYWLLYYSSSQLDQYLTEVQHMFVIWLRQMPPHSGNRSWLDWKLTCWQLLRRILYAHQHHRLTWGVFFCVVADAVEYNSHLKYAQKLHMSEISESAVWMGFALWAVCLRLTAAFEQFNCVLYSKLCWFLCFKLVRLFRLMWP